MILKSIGEHKNKSEILSIFEKYVATYWPKHVTHLQKFTDTSYIRHGCKITGLIDNLINIGDKELILFWRRLGVKDTNYTNITITDKHDERFWDLLLCLQP